jgi:hypothetical protein
MPSSRALPALCVLLALCCGAIDVASQELVQCDVGSVLVNPLAAGSQASQASQASHQAAQEASRGADFTRRQLRQGAVARTLYSPGCTGAQAGSASHLLNDVCFRTSSGGSLKVTCQPDCQWAYSEYTDTACTTPGVSTACKISGITGKGGSCASVSISNCNGNAGPFPVGVRFDCANVSDCPVDSGAAAASGSVWFPAAAVLFAVLATLAA